MQQSCTIQILPVPGTVHPPVKSESPVKNRFREHLRPFLIRLARSSQVCLTLISHERLPYIHLSIYTAFESTASGVVIMEDGEFWDIEMISGVLSFWTFGVSDSASGTEIISAIREYGRVATQLPRPDISGTWSAGEVQTISASGLRETTQDPQDHYREQNLRKPVCRSCDRRKG